MVAMSQSGCSIFPSILGRPGAWRQVVGSKLAEEGVCGWVGGLMRTWLYNRKWYMLMELYGRRFMLRKIRPDVSGQIYIYINLL